MSLIVVFMVMLINDSEILVETEDRACQEERLRHIVEQAPCHVVDLYHLISHERDAAHDKQHRTGILRDFEAVVVFHGVRKMIQKNAIVAYTMVASPAAPSSAAIT